MNGPQIGEERRLILAFSLNRNRRHRLRKKWIERQHFACDGRT